MDIGPADGEPNGRGEGLWRQSRRPATLAASLHQFFPTTPIACPYVPGRTERKLIVELGINDGDRFYGDLSRAGFRRSHRFAYRPACRDCAACVPVRIVVACFAHTRSTRRIRNANRDLVTTLMPARATPEQFRLFSAYQRLRHGDSDMATMSWGDYRSMVEDSPVRTRIAEFRDGEGNLAATSLIDLLDDGISAVYSFYDPLRRKRSLGSWSILWLVEECRRRNLAHVYLGYWIGESRKMAYKARFPALESLTAAGWADFSAPMPR
ncbi:MAG TPA: arginyltransferase [Stellaceae bacterium]|jgi:arginine-tRNA-protein transferase